MLLTISAGWETFIQFATVAVVFAIVLGLTWFTTVWTAGYQKGRMSQSNLEVISTIRLNANKYVQIIRCGRKYLAVAVCKDTVTVLTELSEEDIEHPVKQESSRLKFNEILEKAKSDRPKE